MSELEFVQQRFRIVKKRLDDPNEEIERVDRIQLQREHRLLGKFLYEVPEGKVLQTLQSWRLYLGNQWAEHNKSLKDQRRAYEEWKRLPPHIQATTDEPELPSAGAKVTDKDNFVWIVDDRFLAMMGDLEKRLLRWLETI